MSSRERNLAVAVSLIGLVLLLALQILSWREHRRLNPGAFLLLIFVLGPLFSLRRG